MDIKQEKIVRWLKCAVFQCLCSCLRRKGLISNGYESCWAKLHLLVDERYARHTSKSRSGNAPCIGILPVYNKYQLLVYFQTSLYQVCLKRCRHLQCTNVLKTSSFFWPDKKLSHGHVINKIVCNELMSGPKKGVACPRCGVTIRATPTQLLHEKPRSIRMRTRSDLGSDLGREVT